MYVISSIYGMLRGSNALQLCTLYGYVQRRIAIYTLVGASKKKKKKLCIPKIVALFVHPDNYISWHLAFMWFSSSRLT